VGTSQLLSPIRRTGEGQNIDLSSTEVLSSMMGEAFVGCGLTGRIPQRMGNRDDSMAPHSCYRCQGEGEWITIAVRADTEWRGLCTVIGDPDLEAEHFATARLRWQNQDRLDEIVDRWTRTQQPAAAAEVLQRAGVAAARVRTGADLSEDPHVVARQVFQPVEHPRLGEVVVVRPPWRLEGANVSASAPLLGQHNEYVLGEIMGLPPEEIGRLVEEQVVY